MGNNSSCFPRCSSSSGSTALLLVPGTGRTRHISIPATAAELMLDAPSTGHVVAHAGELARSRRVVGMRAEEQLVAGEIYLLLPKSRVGSKVDDRQLEVIREALGKMGCKVLPGAAGNSAGQVGEVNQNQNQKVKYYFQWKPFLDTIPESSLEFLTLYMLMQMDDP